MLRELYCFLFSGVAVSARAASSVQDGTGGRPSNASASMVRASDGGFAASMLDGPITLRSDGIHDDIFIIDHGLDVAGLPTFQVLGRSGDTSKFEMTYSETRTLLDNYMGDGPLPLAAAMDSYRVNRYNIDEIRTYTNRLVQGGQRYQKLNLSTAGELTLAGVGIKFQTQRLPVEDLAGQFECSDEEFNQIWKTGARTIQMTEIPAGVAPDFYEITDEGLLCDSQVPQPYSSVAASALTSYNLTFHVKPLRGGFGYTVLSDTLGKGIYIVANVAHSSIAAFAGSSDLNSAPLAEATLAEGTLVTDSWHEIHTEVGLSAIKVSINGSVVFQFSQSSSFYGSFGVGASFLHKAVYQNVTLSAGGKEMYRSSLKDRAALKDFLAGTNPLPASVDGARRDRIAYAGDLDIALRSTFASTYGIEYLNGSFNLLGSFQLTPGFFVPTVKIQQSPRTEPIDANITGLIGYSFNLVAAMGEYYMMTGDVAFAQRWSASVTAMLDWAHSQLSPTLGLFNVTDPSFGGDWNYYDPAQSGVVSKFNAVYAYALQSAAPLLCAASNASSPSINTTLYAHRLAALRAAMNAHLWSANLTAYVLSTTNPSAFAQDANALALLASVPPTPAAAAALLASMRTHLLAGPGALSFSRAAASAAGVAALTSPYASGYHLRAALAFHDHAAAQHLLRRVYGRMADATRANYTGCMWETLDASGQRPGLGAPTSLCHAWGAAATGELTRGVLGVRPARPGFVAWEVRPATVGGVLSWARGRQMTPRGAIEVEWKRSAGAGWEMNVTSPAGTSGRVYLPVEYEGKDGVKWEVNGRECEGVVFEVVGGEPFELREV